MIIPLTLYRKSASIGFHISQPRYESTDSGSRLREGAVFMTIAKSTGEKQYDIKGAGKVALGTNEVAEIIYNYDVLHFPAILKFVHTYKEKTSNIFIGPSEHEKYKGSYGWSIVKGKEPEDKFSDFTDAKEMHYIISYLKSNYHKLFEVESYDPNSRSSKPDQEAPV